MGLASWAIGLSLSLYSMYFLRGAPCETRTHTVEILSLLSLPIGLMGPRKKIRMSELYLLWALSFVNILIVYLSFYKL
jgi:hypothetical protein